MRLLKSFSEQDSSHKNTDPQTGRTPAKTVGERRESSANNSGHKGATAIWKVKKKLSPRTRKSSILKIQTAPPRPKTHRRWWDGVAPHQETFGPQQSTNSRSGGRGFFVISQIRSCHKGATVHSYLAPHAIVGTRSPSAAASARRTLRCLRPAGHPRRLLWAA